MYTFLKSGVSVVAYTFSHSSLNESPDFLFCVPLALSPTKFLLDMVNISI